MDFLINGVADFLNEVAKILPKWQFVHDIAQDVATIQPYVSKANVLLPIDTMLTLFVLWLGLELMLVALYWLNRVVNLIRGAG